MEYLSTVVWVWPRADSLEGYLSILPQVFNAAKDPANFQGKGLSSKILACSLPSGQIIQANRLLF